MVILFFVFVASAGTADPWPACKGYLEVYVSAVENAGHFWVQVLGARSTQLDRLITNMTELYDREAEKVSDRLPTYVIAFKVRRSSKRDFVDQTQIQI